LTAIDTSRYALKAYEFNYLKFEDLKGFDAAKIRALTSEYSLEAYKSGYSTFKDLEEIDVDKIQFLISPSVVMLCLSIGIQCADLKDLDVEYLKLLISKSQEQSASIEKCKKEKVKNGKSEKISFEELKSIVDLVDIEDRSRCNIL